ncbi:acyltransferase [Methylophilus sp.]|uniref:acyltransferase family protein n=1 Tax=Methylophilus sp. TaxID=29541 RepID=UPI002D806824|nr:acyltransferase [Methylophilus sp.]
MRNERIDIVRFIGLSMIIFAHVDPPRILFQLRNFDVPLMILVSAMSFSLSYKTHESYSSYVWKRVKRLVFPVWIFLSFYFLALFVLDPVNKELQATTVLTSYTLLEGIGYVWVIRVFLLVALISPFIFAWHQNTASESKYFGALGGSLLLYEIVRYFSMPYIWQGAGEIAAAVLLYVIPYGLLFAIGLRMANATRSQLYAIAGISLGIFTFAGTGLFLFNGEFIPTQSLKYPPSIYYFSYALFISSLLWIYSERIEYFLEQINIKNVVLFIASNSIWIYLWHIPFIKHIHTHYVFKFFIVFTSAVVVTYVQISLVSRLLKHIDRVALKKNIKILFTG